MKKLISAIVLIFLISSCSNDDDSTVNSKINPPETLLGTWTDFENIYEFTISRNNVTEKTSIYSLNVPEIKTFNYGEMFLADNYIIEEESASNSYRISFSNASDSIEYFYNTNFRIPAYRYFELLPDGRIVMNGPGYSGTVLSRVE